MLPKIYRIIVVLFTALLTGSLAIIALTGNLSPLGIAYAAPPAVPVATANLPYTPTVVITRPQVSEIIAAASVPTYSVLVEVAPNCVDGGNAGCNTGGSLLLKNPVTLTIRSLTTSDILTLTQTFDSHITRTQTLTFNWRLPISRNAQFVLLAKASNGQPTVGTSDPVTVTVNTAPTTTTIFLPLVMKNYALFGNGDFSSGLSGWLHAAGSFNGHGSGLPQTATAGIALLGNSAYQDQHIPVGYGYIAQTFTVQKRYLKIRYRVHTYDIVKGAQSGRYYDTFEVSTLPPWQVTDAIRNQTGSQCATDILNPSGTINPTTQLFFCGGHNATTSGSIYDTGWKTVTVDMQNYLHTNTTLYFAVWSREYASPGYDNKGYYNTWAELDSIQPSDQP